jgi:type VI secretion system protein
MSMGRALLSRIAGRDAAPTDEVKAIVAHLQVLLNTRRGDAVTVPEFGVTDFSDIVNEFPGALPQLTKTIRATILEYEPRLKSVSVRHLPDEHALVLRFEITAQLTGGRTARALKLSTTIRPGGHVDVSS